MSKYSNEFKLKVVKYCIEENHTVTETTQNFNIKSVSSVKQWIRRYKKHGISGLNKNLNCSYNGDFKKNVIEYMHKNHLSLQETAIHFNLGGEWVVSKWERIYYEGGEKALYDERRGRSKNMSSKPRKNKLSKENEKDLVAEVQRLRMENAYLKKLQALIQERTKPKHPKK